MSDKFSIIIGWGIVGFLFIGVGLPLMVMLWKIALTSLP